MDFYYIPDILDYSCVSELCSSHHVLRSMSRSIFAATLLDFPVLPLKSDPTVGKTLEADQ
jgi:hypothetical protein